MRTDHEKSIPDILSEGEIAGAKAGDFKISDGRPFQCVGQCRGYFVFDGNIVIIDSHRPRGVRIVDL